MNIVNVHGEITPESEFCQKVDRILSRDTGITVRKQNVGIGGASGKNIFIDFSGLRDRCRQGSFIDEEKNIILIKGINLHEFGHVVYTTVSPKDFESYGRKIHPSLQGQDWNVRDKAQICFNILEDARIETKLILKYPALKRYFTFCVQELIIKDKINRTGGSYNKTALDLFLLTYGRKFIDRKQAKQYEDLAKQNDPSLKIEEIKEVFNDFLLTTEAGEQIILSVKLALLLVDRSVSRAGREYTPSGAGQKLKQNQENKEELEDAVSKSIVEEEETSEESESEQAGKQIKKIEDVLEEMVNQAEQTIEGLKSELSDEIQRDIQTLDTLRRQTGFSNKDGFESDVEGHALNPKTEDLINSTKLKQLLRKLRNGLQASYIREQKSGKIDIRRAITGRGRTTKIFKKFLPNRLGKSKLGVGILLDSSGSMQRESFDKLMRTAWSIDKALNECGDKDIVVEYSVEYKILKTLYGRKGDWMRHFDGGTDPSEALKQTYNQLMNLRMTDNIKTNIVLLFSDGYFTGGDQIITKMNDAGMHTIFVCPSQDLLGEYGKHNCTESVVIENSGELERALERVIVRIHKDLHRRMNQ